MANKIKFKIKSDKFSDFINKLEDLTKISDTIKLKIDNDNILMYSMLGGNVMLAFKNYLINTRDYLEYGDDMDYSMDVIIANAKKFVKNLNFIKESDKITLEISYKESQDDDTIMSARSLQIVGGKLKVNWISGEHYEMRDINKVALSQRLNLKITKIKRLFKNHLCFIRLFKRPSFFTFRFNVIYITTRIWIVFTKLFYLFYGFCPMFHILSK